MAKHRSFQCYSAYYTSCYSAWLRRSYFVLWLGLGLLLTIAASNVHYLQLNVNTDKFFLQSDVNALANQKFKQTYQIGESIGIYVESQTGTLQPEQLEHLSKLSRELEQLPYVRSVQSLANLWQRSPGATAAEKQQNLRNFVAKHPELQTLHSADWQKLWLLVEFYPYEHYPLSKKAGPLLDALSELDAPHGAWQLPLILEEASISTWEDLQALSQQTGQPSQLLAQLVEQLLQRYQQNLRFIPVGILTNTYRLERELSVDLIKVLIIAGLTCMFFIFTLMQSSITAIAVLLCVLANVVLVFGFSGWLGLAIDKTLVMIPVLLGFGSSVSYCIHIEKSWEKIWGALKKNQHHNQQTILGQAIFQNIRPLSFAALTTVLSLLSFIAVPIPMIRNAGFQSALAVSLSYFLSLGLFCSLLQFCRPKNKNKTRSAIHKPVIALALYFYRHRVWSISVAVILLIASLLLLAQITVDLSTESMLGRKFTYVRELLEVSESEIGAGGFYNIDVVFPKENKKTKEKKKTKQLSNDLLKKSQLQQIAEFEQLLRKTTMVKNVSSVVTFIQSVQRIYRGSKDLPETGKQAEQALLTWERLFRGQRSQWYSKEANSLRMLVQVKQASSQENIAHMQEIRQLAAQIFPARITVEPLGGVFQLAIMNQYITKGLLRSFSLSLLFVAVLLFILLRSLRIGLIALVPNLFPVLLTGATVVLLGRSLEFVSMTVAPMIIGLAVDDTIYFLGHVQTLLRQKIYNQFDLVIKHSLEQIAPALITTTLILCALFASLLFSRASNIGSMGLYTIVAMLAALFSDLFLTPILLRWAFAYKFKNCDGS